MAKMKSVVNMSLLANIAGGGLTHITQADGVPLLNNDPPLIAIDTANTDGFGNPAVALTDAGKALLPNGNAAKAAVAHADTPIYSIITNAILPDKAKRKGGFGGGAPTIYPWATMDVGASFFVPVSEKHPDPVKSMTSAVSSANMKYSEEVGEPKEKTRTKRGPGNKAIIGPDGKPEKETVLRRDRQQVREFKLGAVEAGKTYGGWVAPANGVLVSRVL